MPHPSYASYEKLYRSTIHLPYAPRRIHLIGLLEGKSGRGPSPKAFNYNPVTFTNLRIRGQGEP